MSNEYDSFILKLHEVIENVNSQRITPPSFIMQVLDCLSQKNAGADKVMQNSGFTHYEYEVVRQKQASGFCKKIDSIERLKHLISPITFKKFLQSYKQTDLKTPTQH